VKPNRGDGFSKENNTDIINLSPSELTDPTATVMKVFPSRWSTTVVQLRRGGKQMGFVEDEEMKTMMLLL